MPHKVQTQTTYASLKAAQQSSVKSVFNKRANNNTYCELLSNGANTRRSEAALATNGLVEFLLFHQLRHDDTLADELCDSVASLHLEILLAKVEQKYAHVPAKMLSVEGGSRE